MKEWKTTPAETLEHWENTKRTEILTFFEENIFGKRPFSQYQSVFNVRSTNPNYLDGSAVLKQVEIEVEIEGRRFILPIQAYFPKKERSPVFVYVMLENQAKLYDIMRMPDAPILPIPELLSRGWGACVYLSLIHI